jgi:putative nucleotidyltransferase with HDIG domain
MPPLSWSPIYQSAVGDHRSDLLDESILDEFTSSRRTRPVIRRSRVDRDGVEQYKIVVSRPIVSGNRCYGVINLLIISRFERVPAGKLDALTILTNSAASAITNRALYEDLKDSFMQAIRALANAIEARDPYTAGHTDRVTRLAELVARRLGWPADRINTLRVGCTLHDIGKIGVPDSILNKPQHLTDEERRKMIRHPVVGHKIIKDIKLFKDAIPYVISHHERFDGTGYPRGLKGKDIPVEGRLLAVVDTFDAIMSDRPYRKGAELKVAVQELVDHCGTQFDPDIVTVFIETIRSGELNFKELFGRKENIACLDDIALPVTSESVSV